MVGGAWNFSHWTSIVKQAKWNDRDDLCKFIVSNGALVCTLDYSREICCRCSLYKLSTTAPSFLRSKYFLYTLYTVYIGNCTIQLTLPFIDQTTPDLTEVISVAVAVAWLEKGCRSILLAYTHSWTVTVPKLSLSRTFLAKELVRTNLAV